MMEESDKYKNRANGRLVVNALEHLAVPSTLSSIVDWIMTRTPGDPIEIVRSVRSALAKGLSHGFVDALQRKYFLTSHTKWYEQGDEVIRSLAKRPHETVATETEEVKEVTADEPLPKRRLRIAVSKSSSVTPKKMSVTIKRIKNSKKKA